MRLHALLYHDIVDPHDPDASGLAGAGAAVYKLDRHAFARHLAALDLHLHQPPVPDVRAANAAHTGWALTFDDGGRSALHPTTDMLEQRGWRGHFFVTAGRIGSPAFLSEDEIRQLRERGHIVGSHSWSHPARFSALARQNMVDEWSRSTARLARILGEPITIGSVPGGYYSRAVAEAAALAGITTLFTSEPVARGTTVAGCLVLGRFSVLRDTPPARAANLAAGRLGPRARQWLGWNARKAAKRLGGDYYVSAREALLARNHGR